MWEDVLSRIVEKQNLAISQLSNNYANLAFSSDNNMTPDIVIDSIEIAPRKIIDPDSMNLTSNKSEGKGKDPRSNQVIRKTNQPSPINGFRLSGENSQNQQCNMPTPNLVNSSGKSDRSHKPQNSKIKSSEAPNYEENSIQKLSMMVNGQLNPEECIDQMDSTKKQTHSLINQQQRHKYTTEKLSNVRLKSINLANLKARKSIKTEVSSFINGTENDSGDEQRDYFNSRRNGDIRQSFSINSNVVSYCQSLTQSKINQEMERSKVEKQKKHKNKNSKLTKNTKRHKTEEKQKQKELELFLKNQQQIRSQLRVVYEKKFKLQDKLKKLNRQLRKMQAEETSRAVLNLNKINSSQISANAGYAQILKPRIYLNLDPVEKSAGLRHKKQIESSKKAIEFIQKVSKESLKRRISYHQKVNKKIFQRVRSHVCVDCSRTKCQIEALEGEERNQRAT